jgi:uncharacterized protein YecE (DUF72 family)
MSKHPPGELQVGTSGWIYPHWKGTFYPAGLAEKAFLDYYAQRFSTVEINYSFYKLPSQENFAHWAAATPSNFTFAVKASRYLTHLKKLKDPTEPLQRFFTSVAGLDGKLGPVLFQLPPHWKKNLERLAAFTAALPPGPRYAFEFRDPSWLSDDVYTLLSAHQTALVLSDYRSLPLPLTLTTNFTYIRLHGGKNGPGYTAEELAVWAKRVNSYRSNGIDVYVYFNNDPGANAPRDAQSLLQKSNAALIEL